MNENIEDKELWILFKDGDKPAFDKIYKKYAKVLYNYGCKIINDKPLVLDCIHDLFLDLWRLRDNLIVPDSIKFYLFKSMRNILVKQITKNKLDFEGDEQIFELRLPVFDDIETEIIAGETATELKLKLSKAFQQLSENQKEVLNLRFYEDFSYQEIAQILQINEQSVRNLIQRAIYKLREIIISIAFFLFQNFFFKIVS